MNQKQRAKQDRRNNTSCTNNSNNNINITRSNNSRLVSKL